MKKIASYHGSRGFTLVEVLISSALIAMIVAAAAHGLMLAMNVNARTMTQGMVQTQARQTLDTLVRELKDSGEGSTGWAVGLNPDPGDQYYGEDVSQLSFSRCIGYDPEEDMLEWDEVVMFRHQPPSGAEPGKLIRGGGGAETVICDYVSDFRARYLRDEGSFVLTVTVTRPDPRDPGHIIQASHTTTVKLRN